MSENKNTPCGCRCNSADDTRGKIDQWPLSVEVAADELRTIARRLCVIADASESAVAVAPVPLAGRSSHYQHPSAQPSI